jgi:hypothetical protein
LELAKVSEEEQEAVNKKWTAIAPQARRRTKMSRSSWRNAMIPCIAVVLLLLVSPAGAADMQKYLSDTNDMVTRGEYEEALKRYVWFHNHSVEQDQAMYGVRLSFALSSWKSLGEKYPPATEALVQMRDQKTKRVLAKPGDFALFHDVVSLNRTLEQDDQSLQDFEALRGSAPEFAKKCWPIIKDVALAAKRFDLAREYLENPLAEYARIHGMYLMSISFADKVSGDREVFAKMNEDRFVAQCLELIEVAIALDDEASAREIQAKALTVVDDGRLRAAVPLP